MHGVVLNIAMMLCYSRFCIHKFEDTQGIWIGSGMVRSLSVSQLITRVRAWSTHFVRHLNSHVYTNDSLTKCVTITCVHPWLTQNVCHRLSREYTPDILVKCVVDYYVCKPMTHSRSVSQAVTVTCAYPAMTRPLNVPLCVYTRKVCHRQLWMYTHNSLTVCHRQSCLHTHDSLATCAITCAHPWLTSYVCHYVCTPMTH